MADAPSREPITQLLSRVRRGDGGAEALLMDIVYGELRKMAVGYMRRERPDHTLQPTALVHEAYMRLVDQPERDWQNRKHFFAAAAQMMNKKNIPH